MNLLRPVTPTKSFTTITLSPSTLETLRSFTQGTKIASITDSARGLFLSGSSAESAAVAEAIAHELGRILYRVDLSAVVSKFIGETEKNLARVFSEAENNGAVLLLDEADALFKKRTEIKDGHDRFANVEINYLLQKMEAYKGVTIIATNTPVNLPSCRFCRYVDLRRS